MLKLLTAVNDEYQHLLTQDKLLADSQWFEEQDERIFIFKHKIIKWLKEAELKKEKRGPESQWDPEAVNPGAVSHQGPAIALLDQASKIKQ